MTHYLPIKSNYTDDEIFIDYKVKLVDNEHEEEIIEVREDCNVFSEKFIYKNLHTKYGDVKYKTDSDFIQFLLKELLEMMYHREINSEQMTVYHKIIHKWREENDK